mmetsp:Transcript_15370/g.29743  ORF Transcript_15370/g.29743 Transcript_15370/m.29743 type:complete len:80 (+) Transcript_15370:766-1005(+)
MSKYPLRPIIGGVALLLSQSCDLGGEWTSIASANSMNVARRHALFLYMLGAKIAGLSVPQPIGRVKSHVPPDDALDQKP